MRENDSQADTAYQLESSLAEFEARFDSLDQLAASQRSSIEAIRSELNAISQQIRDQPPRVIVRQPTIDSDDDAPEPQPGKLVVGRFEEVWIEDLQVALPARIDTAAETASLGARDITSFERDGEPWVRFDIRNPTGGEPLTLERPRVREALVQQGNDKEPERRAVIELGIQLGPIRQLAEFTLSDRSRLEFQMLVGRNILRDVMLVDVSAINLVPPPEPPVEEDATADTQGDDEPTAAVDDNSGERESE